MNKKLFATTSPLVVNEAGGKAVPFTAKHALAQFAVTGCFNNTYYVSGADQLDKVIELCKQVPLEYVAKLAVYARAKGYMKDMPAALLAFIAGNKKTAHDRILLNQAFDEVVDNAKMLRNFVQMIRSGKFGRKSLGTQPKKLIQNWFNKQTAEQIFRNSVGQTPSIADIIKLAHVPSRGQGKDALYKYLLGKEYSFAELPELVRQYEAFKTTKNIQEIPGVPFQMLDSLGLDTAGWSAVARSQGWHMLRMNLNTFQRHGVFKDKEMVRYVASRLRDVNSIKFAKAFPYQLLMAYKATEDIPPEIREALQDAMEIAVENTPKLDGEIVLCIDVSGSMSSPVTGNRGTATSKVLCTDVAGLVAAAILRKNPSARVIPFEGDVVRLVLNPRDSVMTNAATIATVGGGGTNCSAPLALLNRENYRADAVIYVSDNQSWVDRGDCNRTGTMREWDTFRKHNPNARMVCIDVQPNATAQAKDVPAEVLNIGGFSDTVFETLSAFLGNKNNSTFVDIIEQVEL